MKNVLYAIWELSFITARYDSLCLDSNSTTAYLNTGEKYKWASLKMEMWRKVFLIQLGIEANYGTIEN